MTDNFHLTEEAWRVYVQAELSAVKKDIAFVRKVQFNRHAVELSALSALGIYLLPKFVSYLVTTSQALQ